MTFEAVLAELTEREKRLSAKQLVDLSNLDVAEVAQLAEVWPEVDPSRRVTLLAELSDLTQDNVELNYDAVFKLALADEEPLVRAAAIRGLFEYEGEDLIPVLSQLLREDTDPDVRREAAIALGRFALAAELGYLDERDREDLKSVLIESAEDIEEDERVRARAIEALGAISGEDTENLIESIYNEDSLWLKIGAVDAMGRSARETWLPRVRLEMTNRAPEMRHAATFAAGEIGAEEAVPDLKFLAIEDPDREVQLAAIHALSEIGGDQARVALKSLLFEADDDLREPVQEAMTELSFNDDPLNAFGR